MRWNMRLAAAHRGIWKASDLQRLLAEHGLVISAGKMSGLWSGQPVSLKLDDLDVICAVLGCEVGDLLIPSRRRSTGPARSRAEGRAGGATGGDAQAPRRPVTSPGMRAGSKEATSKPTDSPAGRLPGLGQLQRTALPCLLHVRPQPRRASLRRLSPHPASEVGLLPSVLVPGPTGHPGRYRPVGRRGRRKGPDPQTRPGTISCSSHGHATSPQRIGIRPSAARRTAGAAASKAAARAGQAAECRDWKISATAVRTDPP